MRPCSRFVSSLTALALMSSSVVGYAQVQPVPYPQQPPPGPPPPPSALAPNGEYVSPIQQQTQPTYVPQSVAMSGPRRITDWDESEPVPPGYHVQQQVRKGMVVGGAVLFGALYLISLMTAAIAHDNHANDDALYIPGAGPFLQMGSQGQNATGSLFLAIDGVAQCAGIGMFIFGIASPRTVLVRNDLGLKLTPMRVGSDGYGWGLAGHF